ncbi:hypothetical protein [Fischerella sp.]|uniref:hypothetical protein n=1 Tax=Fischerella sp. TaxID=1191 RepID=UPI0025B997FE|nr:hypothetical protein [Fischerella sp.]
MSFVTIPKVCEVNVLELGKYTALSLRKLEITMNKMYHCGKRGCPGHHSQYEQCLFDTINFEIPKINKMPEIRLSELLEKYYCGKQGCPGHLVKGQQCINQIRLSELLEKYYCGKQGCPGHFIKGQQCINW